MGVTAFGLTFSTLYVCVFSQSFTFPANEYEFSIRRDALKQAERIFEGKSTDLTEVCNSVVTQLNFTEVMEIATEMTFRSWILSKIDISDIAVQEIIQKYSFVEFMFQLIPVDIISLYG